MLTIAAKKIKEETNEDPIVKPKKKTKSTMIIPEGTVVKPRVMYELCKISPSNKWIYYEDGTYKVYPTYKNEFIKYFAYFGIVPKEFNVKKVSFIDGIQ